MLIKISERSQGKRPVLGIYLAYYNDYGIAGLNIFKKFLLNLDANAELIVSCNGSVFEELKNFPAHVIRGNNVIREFSGWESALDYARAIDIDLDKYLLIFANDTFCYHNNFGPVSRFAFTHAFKKMMKNPKFIGLAGEVWAFGERYEVDGFAAEHWVATYLFATSGETVKKIGSICPTLPMERFYAYDTGRLHFSKLLSQNLANHIVSWLAGGGHASWRNHASSDISSLDRLQGKANSIISEKYLSAKACSAGGVLVGVFNAHWIQQLRRFETLYTRIKKRLRR